MASKVTFALFKNEDFSDEHSTMYDDGQGEEGDDDTPIVMLLPKQFEALGSPDKIAVTVEATK